MVKDAAFRNKWLVMAAIGMGIFLSTIDSSIVNVALPTLVIELDTTFSIIEWVVLIYLVTLSILMLSVGRIADMVGKKSIYLIGFIVFLLGSLFCGLSSSVYTLIGFRIFQAIGAAFVMVLGIAIVIEAFPSQERGMAMGITGTIVSAGVITGPTIGGIIIHSFPWNWIFFVNLPLGLIGIVLILKYVPKSEPGIKQHFDIAGAVTMFIALGSLLFSLTFVQLYGINHPIFYILLVSFVIFLVIFIQIERKSKEPMLDLTVFKSIKFSTNVLTGFLSFVSMAGTIILMPFFLTNVLLFSPGKIGLLMGVIPAVMAFTAPIAGKLSDSYGSRVISLLGLISLFGGMLALSFIGQNSNITGYVLRTIPIGLGMGLFQSPNNSAIMGSVPKTRLGIASGIMSLTRTLGQTTGIAIFGAIWAGRITSYLVHIPIDGATSAPLAIQTASLQDVLRISSAVIFIGIIISAWAFYKEATTQYITTEK